MLQTLFLSDAIYARMLAHARAQWPAEACGLVRGHHGRARELLPARNVASDPLHNYQIDGESLLQALRWEDAGDTLLAIYHSHPHTAAFPSLVDAANAFYPYSIYLILSLQTLDAPRLRGFYLRPEMIFDDAQAAHLRRQLDFEAVRPGLWGLHLPDAGPELGMAARSWPDDVSFYLFFGTTPRPPQTLRLVSVQPVPVVIEL